MGARNSSYPSTGKNTMNGKALMDRKFYKSRTEQVMRPANVEVTMEPTIII
jgi:hypothetical protein